MGLGAGALGLARGSSSAQVSQRNSALAFRSAGSRPASTAGPLRVHSRNPRYFADSSGKPVYLAGTHTWATLQDIFVGEEKRFDWPGFLQLMQDHNHNFLRMWHWEQAAWAPWTVDKIRFSPTVYARTGPGLAEDGEPRFDLTKFNPAYFDRLRTRVQQCRDRGIYVSVMLFQGFSHKKPSTNCDPWPGHPYNVKNNTNRFNGDKDGDSVPDLHDPAVREMQLPYIKKVVDTVNGLDNVLYEVANEGGNMEWDWWVVDSIHKYQVEKAKQHPVGITAQETRAEMLASPADWMSPGSEGGLFKTDPPPWDGRKVSLIDTDHIWGHGGTPGWVWKSFTRGHNPLLMDAWEPLPGAPCRNENWDSQPGDPNRNVNRRDHPIWEPVRKALGHTRTYALRMDFAEAVPYGELASTRYCLASFGKQYLVYLPEGDECTLDLSGAGELTCEWMHPVSGEITQGGTVKGGRRPLRFCVPFLGPAVLFCYAK